MRLETFFLALKMWFRFSSNFDLSYKLDGWQEGVGAIKHIQSLLNNKLICSADTQGGNVSIYWGSIRGNWLIKYQLWGHPHISWHTLRKVRWFCPLTLSPDPPSLLTPWWHLVSDYVLPSRTYATFESADISTAMIYLMWKSKFQIAAISSFFGGFSKVIAQTIANE